MEKIIRSGGVLYYGELPCRNPAEAYKRFRDDYNTSLGNNVKSRLNRVGDRRERQHGFGFVLEEDYSNELKRRFTDYDAVDIRLLGLVGLSYCWRISGAAFEHIDESEFDVWLDWVLDHSNRRARRFRGRRDHSGRTSSRLRTRYR